MPRLRLRLSTFRLHFILIKHTFQVYPNNLHMIFLDIQGLKIELKTLKKNNKNKLLHYLFSYDIYDLKLVFTFYFVNFADTQ